MKVAGFYDYFLNEFFFQETILILKMGPKQKYVQMIWAELPAGSW